MEKKAAHIPVLLQQTIDSLGITEGETIVDATLGLGGHAQEICRLLGPAGMLVGIDQDGDTLAIAKENLAGYPGRKLFALDSFRNIKDILDKAGIGEIDAVLFDLGFSSAQMDGSGRGFSFQKNEPLLMTLASNITPETVTADDIVNTWSEESLSDIIYGYGEEKFSKRIAKAIVEERARKNIKTTFDLVSVIKNAVPAWYTHSRLHFATKTFQALRIAVNDELGSLKEGLQGAWEKLRPGGKIAAISFHGLEAKIIKDFIKGKKKDGEIEIVERLVKPDRSEILSNPRSRSAQLRVFKKIENV